MKHIQDKKALLKRLQDMRVQALKGASVSLATVSGVLSTKTNLLKYASFELGFDLVTTKSFQVVANAGNREPIICQPEGECFGNSVGLRNPGIDVAVAELTHLRSSCALLSILNVSLSASSPRDFITLIKRVEHIADMVELNFSCPHASAGFGSAIGGSLEIARSYVKEIVESVCPTPVLIFIKLTPNVENIGEIAKAVIEEGADGIVAINTVGPSVYIEPHSNAPILQNKLGGKGGRSGKWVFTRAIECVEEIRKAVDGNVPIIGMGGVSKGEDVAKMVKAGANVVGIGSAFGTVKQQDWIPYLSSLRTDALSALKGEASDKAEQYVIKSPRMDYTPYKIRDIRYTSDDVMIMQLEGEMPFKAGQFVFLWLAGVGEKPFSLCLASPITFIIKKRGAFTSELFKKQKGEVVYVRGLYGQPLSLAHTKEAVLLAGGTGIALLPSLAEQLRQNNTKIDIYVGSSKDMRKSVEVEEGNIIEEKLKSYGNFNLVHDNGVIARVLDFIEKEASSYKGKACYIVGPMQFMKRAASIFVAKGADESLIFLSLEQITMCGVGLCGECSIGNKLTCQMGTFITLAELEKMEAY